VPWGLYRFHESRLPHFITFTCYRRQSFLNTASARDAVLRVLERTRLRYDFLIYGFVVMPNHVHLLVSEPKQGTVATVIQSLKISSARWEKTHICQKMADMAGGPPR
jgi:putative transposase